MPEVQVRSDHLIERNSRRCRGSLPALSNSDNFASVINSHSNGAGSAKSKCVVAAAAVEEALGEGITTVTADDITGVVDPLTPCETRRRVDAQSGEATAAVKETFGVRTVVRHIADDLTGSVNAEWYCSCKTRNTESGVIPTAVERADMVICARNAENNGGAPRATKKTDGRAVGR